MSAQPKIKETAPAIAELYADWAASLTPEQVPAALKELFQNLVIDMTGLCIAARRRDYIAAILGSCDAEGRCTAIGHAGGFDCYDAALVNGTAMHGEDFDDTFEGTPVHVGAVLVPALLALGEARQIAGPDLLRGLAAGAELTCRLALVAPTAIHRAGFHPTAVVGALGAAAACGTALKLDPPRLAAAIGIAGSFASGIIEYLAEGTWPKRAHAGWAAQSGIRAARLAEGGFTGPRTVFEGEHGFFKGFADAAIPRRYEELTDGLGSRWHGLSLAFKPYACGTMCQPFMDCALRLRQQGVTADRIASIHCTVGEGTVHRLWEPRAEKIAPSSAFSAKFSVPYGIAIAFVDGAAGLTQFTAERVSDPAVRALAAKVSYEIDPEDEYPRNYSGYLKVTLADGSVVEARQPHLRGGRREPLTKDDILAKLAGNLSYGGWPDDMVEKVSGFGAGLFDGGAPDLTAFRK